MPVWARIFFSSSSFFSNRRGWDRRAEEGQRDREERERGGEWVGGRTGGATRNSYQLIITEQGEEKKESWQTSTENWHVFLEAGSWELKRQIWLPETAEMIIKGDLDRMAEDIGHAGKSQQAGTRSFKLCLTKAGFYLIAVSDHF